MDDPFDRTRSVAFGVVGRTGKPLGGLVLHNWNPRYRYMEISGAGRGPWLTKALLGVVYDYTRQFIDNVVFRTSEDNTAALRTLKALGASCTLIPALRGPRTGEYFCVIEVQKFAGFLDHGRKQRADTTRPV